MSRLDEQIATLAAMDKDELKDRWARLTGRDAPRVSTALLRLAIAYELQAKAAGGLSRAARQQLERGQPASAALGVLRPGMRLARAFGGKVHVVTIGGDGEILWNERQWKSLSEVARAITGTRWSGPAFFELKARKAA